MQQRFFASAFLLFLFVFTFYAIGIGNRPFFTKGEAREAEVVSQMWHHDNLVLPLRNGEEIPSKPPLFHWLGYGAAKLSGSLSEAAIRFPSAICGALVVLATFLFYSSAAGSVALITSLLLLSSIEMTRNASHARVDMCFTFFVVLSMMSLFNLYETRRAGKSSLLWLLASIVFSTGSVLAKGPAGALFPWTILTLYILLSNGCSIPKAWKSIPVFKFVAVLLLSLAGAGVWYWLAYLQKGQEFLDVQLLRENAARLVAIEGKDVGHAKPLYFSLLYLLSAFLPWTVFLPLTVSYLYSIRRQLTAFDNRHLLFSLIWLSVFVVVVGISQSKRSVYLLPAIPALAYLTAVPLVTLAREGLARSRALVFSRWLYWMVAVALLLVAIAAIAALSMPVPLALKEGVLQQVELLKASMLQHWFLPIALLLLAAVGLLGAYRMQKGSVLSAVYLLFAITCSATLLGNLWTMPLLARVAPEVQFFNRLSAMSNTPQLVQYKDTFYGLVFYGEHDISRLHLPQDLQRVNGESIVVTEKFRPEVQAQLPDYYVEFEIKDYIPDQEDWLVLLSPTRPSEPATALVPR